MVIRIGRGVPGRRRIPAWVDMAAHVGQLVLLVLLLAAALLPPATPAGAPRWTYETSSR